jgi:predicted kinase
VSKLSKLIVICGLPYAGKTTLGAALVASFGHAAVDVDATKERLYGVGLTDDELTQDHWHAIYAQTDQQIADYLHSGTTVVDDSRNFRKAERMGARAIAHSCDAQLITVWVDTPVEVVRQRLVENRQHPKRHDMADADFEHLLRSWEAPTADERPLLLRQDDRLQDWLHLHAHELT